MIKLRIKGSYLLGALFYMRNINTLYSILDLVCLCHSMKGEKRNGWNQFISIPRDINNLVKLSDVLLWYF